MKRATLVLAALVLLVGGVGQARANMVIATFSDSGGPVSYQTVDTSGLELQAFGVQGNTEAYWGITGLTGYGPQGTGVSLFQGPISGPLTLTDLSFPSGVYGSGSASSQSLAFDASYQAVLDYNVDAPYRFTAIAVGPSTKRFLGS